MNTKPTRIKVKDRPYLVYRDHDADEETFTGSFDKLLRQLLIHDADKPATTIGCVTFRLGILAAYSWEADEDTNYGKEERRELALANLLPHLQLNINQLREVFGHSYSCLIYSFDKDGDGYKDDRRTYNIQLKDGSLKTSQRIVFPNGVVKKDVEREILQILLNSLEENPGTYMLFEDLQASIPLTTKALIFNLNLLKEDDKVDFVMFPHSDPPKIVSVKIKSKGIKALEGDTETAIQSPQMVKNIGVNIENLITHGDNSPINISVGDINTAFGNIIKQIEGKEFEGKKEVLESVKELQNELGGDKNPKKVKSLMGKIKSKATWVYNLIFKNPVLTAYLTQLLLKTL